MSNKKFTVLLINSQSTFVLKSELHVTLFDLELKGMSYSDKKKRQLFLKQKTKQTAI